MLDLDILAVGNDGAVLVAVGAVLAVGKIARRLVVIHKLKEGGAVAAVHIGAALFDLLLQQVGVGVQGVLVGKAAGAGGAGPVDAVVVAVAPVADVADVQILIFEVALILVHNDGLTLVDVQPGKGQQQLEELVAAGTHGAELTDVLVVDEHGHKAGDAALDLDFDQDIGLGQAALRAGCHDVVDHNTGDALPLGVVFVLFLAGQDVGLIRFGGGFGGRLGGGCCRGRSRRRCRRTGGGATAGCQHHAQREHRHNKSD